MREAKVYSEIVPREGLVETIREKRPIGVIFSGGPMSVHVDGAPDVDGAVFELGVPILGICYGAQLLSKKLGGTVSRTGTGEYGRTALEIRSGSPLFREMPESQMVWMSHSDSITEAPDGFSVTATTEQVPVAALENRDLGLYGVQFHPEVAHTKHGQEMLKHFLYDICDARSAWTMTSVIEQSIDEIRERVGGEKIICGLSGGVDSAVAAALVHKAVGEQLTCVFVDHGLLRRDEPEKVVDTFRSRLGFNLVEAKASDRFLERLSGVTDPEEKRKIIGETFIRVFEEVAHDASLGPDGMPLDTARFLVQGTLYPDIIESGTRDAAKIKSHHNVGGLPEEMAFELVEPLRNLFKDEVRVVGEELGLPEEIVWRQPFPGPGLAVRIIGEVTAERLEILRNADAVLLEEIRKAGLYREVWQSFAVLPAIRSVGVMGDERTYAYPIVIRAVTSDDAMTADWARIPFDVLEAVSSRIINEVDGVNRVAYDISSKPPATIEWE